VAGLTEQAASKAIREVEALKNCSHENMIRYYDSDVSETLDAGPLLYIVMEHFEARDLTKIICD